MSNREELIGKVISGNASEHEIRELNAWLVESSENQKTYDQQVLLWQFLGKSEKKTTPDVDQAWAKFLVKKEEKKKTPFLIYKIAAVFIVLVTAGSILSYLYFFNGEKPKNSGLAKINTQLTPDSKKPVLVLNQPEVQPASKVRKFQKRKDSTSNEILFPDSSVVILSPNSVLKFLEYESDQPRIASLAGAGFFNLRPMSQDFILETEEITMKVQGTRFSVQTATEEKRFIEITVEEGFMEASEKANPSNKISIFSSQSYVYNVDTHEFTKVNFETKSNSKWKNFVNKLNQTFRKNKKDRKKNKNPE